MTTPAERATAERIEVIRKALMVAHHHDWDMETVAEAAHIAAPAVEVEVERLKDEEQFCELCEFTPSEHPDEEARYWVCGPCNNKQWRNVRERANLADAWAEWAKRAVLVRHQDQHERNILLTRHASLSQPTSEGAK